MGRDGINAFGMKQQAGTLALLMSLAVSSGWAQTTAAQEPPRPEPGAGAQVHTGAKSGLELVDRLRSLLADHQYAEIEPQIDVLPPTEAKLFRGILANRNNDAKASIELLEPLVEEIAAAGDQQNEKLVRKALAEDYLRLGDWQKASVAYAKLAERLDTALTADEKDEIELPVKLLPLIAQNPPMSVEPCDPFLMQVDKDPLGLTDLPVFVDAMPHRWMLDPTAPFNLMARSSAHEVGIKLSEQTATIRTLTGRPIVVHMAIVPRFTIGGRLTLRNMTVFVYDDADYQFPRSEYQVYGVLGYPALAAMGRVTVTSNSTVEVRPARQISTPTATDKLTDGARFYLDGDQLLVELQHDPPTGEAASGASAPRIYAIDPGAQQSWLSSRYYDEHLADFAGQKKLLFTLPGLAGLAPQPAYVAESVDLWAGHQHVAAHYLQVLTAPLGNVARDDLYGQLGIDFLDQLKSYTFDYRTMRFSATAE